MDTTQEEVLRKYPRLIAHLICHSLGYFTPRAAANAILYHKRGEPFFCEWYSHMASFRSDGVYSDNVRDVGVQALADAFDRRHGHRGYMSSYKLAKKIVAEAIGGNDPIFASWF